MGRLEVSASTPIAAPAELVRRQFGDVAHHEAVGPHRGVRFTVVEDGDDACRYHQETRLGPLRLRQELVLRRTAEGPLVNAVVAGQLAGGTITFDVAPAGPERCTVTARVEAPLRSAASVAAPLLRGQLRRSLARALAEDRADIESGGYPARRPR